MEFEGIIIENLGVREGSGKNGNWKAAGYVAETEERNPQRIVFDVWDGRDGRIERFNLQVGKKYKLYLSFEASEHEGKWYNRISVWGARLIES